MGKKLKFHGQPTSPCTELTKDSFAGIDIALFSAGGSISKEFAPIAAKAGCVVVDNSSAFRMDDAVPLVVPEINAADVQGAQGHHRQSELHHGHHAHGAVSAAPGVRLKRIFASSYQAVSGTGAKAIEELERQVDEVVHGQPVTQRSLSAPDRLQRAAARGFLPAHRLHEGGDEDGERGAQDHASPGFRASVTCVRVPVYRAHSVAVSAEFEKPVTRGGRAARCSQKAPGLDVVDDPAKANIRCRCTRPRNTTAQSAASALDCALDNGLCFWVSGDQLLKGAALNAVQIAEELVKA